jgi:hypothetical protein
MNFFNIKLVSKFFLFGFNKSNVAKVFVIFIIGFISRFLINYFYNADIFVDCINIVSVIYYFFFACFIVIVHGFIDYYNFSATPFFDIFTFGLKLV